MASRKRFSVKEVIELVCMPDGALSDAESGPDDDDNDPDFDETQARNVDDESDDASLDDEDLELIARDAPTLLNVQVHKVPQHADTVSDDESDTEPRPGPARLNRQQFTWRHRKPPTADVDATFRGPIFSPPPDDLPSTKWYFDEFMDRSVFEWIAEQSNLYALMKNAPELKTTADEIEQFIGMHILMTVVWMPSYRMYWQETTRYEPVAGVMRRKRFDQLRTYIHMNDNTNVKQKDEPGYDALFKVRPVIEKVRENCLKIEPEEHQSIDEQMIPFKGRIGMKQYIKNKPHKWGIKVFTRAGVCGIVYDFEVYTGKGTVVNERGLGVGGEVVVRLLRDIPNGLNYKCFFDNWFTSPELLVELKQMGILAVGTIGRNRLHGCVFKTDKELAKAGRGSYEVNP